MHDLVIVDTTVFLNILDVPAFNQDRENVVKELETFIKQDASFILPISTIWETGNHIAHLSKGNVRRQNAQKFVEQVKKSINDESPFKTSELPNKADLARWLNTFPNAVQRNKSDDKPTEGLSWGDHTIIGEFEKMRQKYPRANISIWSLDKDLSAYGN